ncbi:dTDP-4-dehydrorhamnose 3,5-epimerase family protein [Aeromonas veronii]|uniref:dTDP-4-dehydrorhamnose 3,5-epimerase family protein n=1 Tax=Aeromonas veronii TaxID=654 RepID=UPI00374E1641
MCYKCDDYHQLADEHAIRWDSPALAITWPLVEQWPLRLLERDRDAACFIPML